jgi:hypothetical protein
MNTPSTLRVDVPGFDAAQIAREAVSAKLTEAMIGSEDMVRKIVVAAMEQKVNSNGQISQYRSDNNTSFVEWLAQDLMREATKAVLKDRVERLRPVLEVEIEKHLKKNVRSIAVALTDSFIVHGKNGYGVTINLTAAFNPPR